MQLALNHEAVLVAPDYRFLPEASAEDILDDIDNFWSWLGNSLSKALNEDTSPSPEVKGLQIDLNNILIEGESAGGYLATQLALGHTNDPHSRIRALISIYPMLDLRAPHWTQAYHKQIFDHPQYPTSLVDDHLATIIKASPRPVITNDSMEGTGRSELAAALVQQGRFLEAMGGDRSHLPGKRRIHTEDRLEDGAQLPPTLFVHGIQDDGVPVEGTDTFIGLIKKYGTIHGLQDGLKVIHFARLPGGHRFDNEVEQDADWVKESCEFLRRFWPTTHDDLVPN